MATIKRCEYCVETEELIDSIVSLHYDLNVESCPYAIREIKREIVAAEQWMEYYIEACDCDKEEE